MSTATNPTRPEILAPSTSRRKSGKLTLWPLVAATFFMVSGGTYGTEDIVHGAGYLRGILILLLTPVIWSLPTAFMIGELSSAIPAEGGYYAWVRRAMGNLWGFQEAWLSLVASIFDMAIYPTLFVAYLTRLVPWFAVGHRGVMVGLAVVIVCALLNIAGVRVVATTSLWLFALLSAPFVLIVLLAPFKFGALASASTTPVTSHVGIMGGLLIAMWNYMGWDNASTIAQEVERPQKTYPRAMICGGGRGGAQLHLAGGRDVDDRHSSQPMGDWLVGRPGWIGRRPAAARRASAGRHDERLRHVQFAGDELLTPAAGDGARWHAPEDIRQSAFEDARALGFDPRAGHGLGALPGIGLRAPGHHRCADLRLQPASGIHGAGLPEDSRAESAAYLPRSRWIVRRSHGWCGSHGDARVFRL